MKTRERIQAHPAYESLSDERSEDGGVWVYLKPLYCNGEQTPCITGGCVHAVHEATFTTVAQSMRSVRRCTCSDCKE